jgi:hypothetical protein
MAKRNVGAVLVVEGERLVGIFHRRATSYSASWLQASTREPFASKRS